jgi:methylated-DNA-[protein]-cysteine S-methyltransferase
MNAVRTERHRAANGRTVVHESNLGPVTLSASSRGLTRVRFGRRAADLPAPRDGVAAEVLAQAVTELDEYLLERRTRFEVPVDLSPVEPPHRQVLDALCRVEYGSTRSYADLARAAGLIEDGPRRAGAACARNPVLVFVPCHRIVAADGALTGYAGGLSIKKALLALESGQFTLDA